jgi:hypothetical protein
MTRRERLIRIIESWGPYSHTYRFERDRVLARMGYAAFVDEALTAMAAGMVDGKRRQARYNAEAKARRAAT